MPKNSSTKNNTKNESTPTPTPTTSPTAAASPSSTTSTSQFRTLGFLVAVILIVGVQLFSHRVGPLYSSLVESMEPLQQVQEHPTQEEQSSSSSSPPEPSPIDEVAATDERIEKERLERFFPNSNNVNVVKATTPKNELDSRPTQSPLTTSTADNNNRGSTTSKKPDNPPNDEIPAASDKPAKKDNRNDNNNNNNNNNNKKPAKPLNVIIFYPDDWRHDDIGGVAPVVRTPFLNELARQGIRFTHNAVTTSICWISRATLFTGQYASRHKSLRLRQPYFYDDWYNTSWPALLQRFQNYFVGHVGKWQFVNRGGIVQKTLFNWTNLHEGAHWFHGQPAANYSRDQAIQFLRDRPLSHNNNDNNPTPFALTVAFYPPKAVTLNPAPGAQWTPSKHFYENDTIPNPPYNVTESYLKLPWFFHQDERYGHDWWKKRFETSEQYQRGMKNYYSLITEVDQACREIVDELKKQQILDETLIIFTTDNGLFHSEHGLAGKWYPYQESIRVPLIVRDPRMHPTHVNTLNDAFTLNVDLASTILGAAGIPVPNQMQGRDLADLYRTPKQPPPSPDQIQQQQLANATDSLSRQGPWRAEFYYEFPLDKGKSMPMSSAVVRHDMKYIWWPQYNFRQLFNLTADPLEQDDIVNKTEYAKLIEQLEERRAILQQAVA